MQLLFCEDVVEAALIFLLIGAHLSVFPRLGVTLDDLRLLVEWIFYKSGTAIAFLLSLVVG